MNFVCNMCRLYAFIAICICVFFTSCKTIIDVPRPEESYTEKKIHDKKESLINVPIEIPISELETQINKYVTGLIYEDKSYTNNGGDNLKCFVKKYGDFQLFAADNKFLIWMPLEVSGTYKKMGAVVNFKGTLKAKYLTEITLLDDWQLITKTQSVGYDWIKKPTADIGLIDVPVKWIFDLIMESQTDAIDEAIDEAVKEYVDLKELIAPAFEAMTEPMNVSEDYNSWFVIEPIEAFITPLNIQDMVMKMTIGMRAYTETYIGKPTDSTDSVKVVPLKVTNDISEEFNMDLVTVMPFQEASLVLDKEFVLSGYEYIDGKYHLTFTRMEIFGQGGKLVILVGLLGSVKGEIYLIGDPYYDAESRRIKMKNVDFHFKSKQALLKSADWLAHGQLCKIMEKNMYFDIGTELDATKKEVQEYLNGYEPVSGVSINGSLGDVETKDIYLIKDAMVIVVNAKGSLNVKIKGL